VYNLLACPFSPEARLKVYFLQEVNLDTGVNQVSVAGLNGYVQKVVHELPSAIGRSVNCSSASEAQIRSDLRTCRWPGLAPNVLADEPASRSAGAGSEGQNYTSWLDYNITRTNNSALFNIQGRNTKHCHILFDTPVSDVQIENAASDPRFASVAEKGSTQIRLTSRDWDRRFRVNVTWPGDQEVRGQTGKVVCLWSDVNQPGVIPAYDELFRFAPTWAVATKNGDGLVEGWKKFKV